MADTGKWWQRLAAAWSERGALGEQKIPGTEREFLPAALEIQETPPNPAGRFVAWSLLTLFTIAVIWACVGQVNIVAVAEGKIIPSGQIKQIQPSEKGVVKTIFVKEGQIVQQGDPLIELDQTLTFADQERIAEDLKFTTATISRQQVLADILNTPKKQLDYVELSDYASQQNTTDTEQLALLWQEWRTFQSRRESLIAEKQERTAEQQASKERIKQLQATIPLLTKRVGAIKSLKDKNLAAESTWMELEEQRIQQTQSLEIEKATQQQMTSAIQKVEKQLNALQAETLSQTLTSIAEQKRQKQNLLQELNKAKDLNKRQILYAPISGKVQQLAIHTIGGVVTPAQPIMLIIPSEAELEVEAWLENKDIGFVYVGQEAEVKINTFPFTKYGIIEGEVIDMTQDAVADEQQQFRYKMKVSMSKSIIQVNDRAVNLIPGMTVSAEIKTGKRKLIEYLLTPLMRYRQESVRER
ncbi:HlyD family type I secretion periplasmic adaptor subunit [Porticoccus sp. GXU_MW_L64]